MRVPNLKAVLLHGCTHSYSIIVYVFLQYDIIILCTSPIAITVLFDVCAQSYRLSFIVLCERPIS